MSETDSPWGWIRGYQTDRDLYEDACLVLERYVAWSEERRLRYVADLLRTGAVTETQGNQLLRTYCNDRPDLDSDSS